MKFIIAYEDFCFINKINCTLTFLLLYSGIIADKTGRYISVLIVNVALTAVLHSSMLLVPKSQFNDFIFTCNEEGYSIDGVNCEKELIPKDGGDLSTISLQVN